MNQCKQCKSAFEITEVDRKFYEMVSPIIAGKMYSVPEPTLCPDCRQQRRLAFCNEMKLYYRKCDLTGKQIISVYHPDSPYTVYNQKDWIEENGWSKLDYGRDFDFSKPFFDQFKSLMDDMPHYALCTDYHMNQNSEFTNYSGSLKDCYLIFHADFNESCYYGYGVKKCKNCVDCCEIVECEKCYECVNCTRCYDLKYSLDCENCHDGAFLDDCIGCSDCFGCSGLRNMQYYINNKPYSKEDYHRLISKFELNKNSKLARVKQLAADYRLLSPKKYLHIINSPNSIGDYLVNCKNANRCFDCEDLEDAAYCSQIYLGAKNCYDVYQFGIKIELCYECTITGYNTQRVLFSHHTDENTHDILYSSACGTGSSNLFGCFGLRRKKYCILNKQYAKEEYERLVPKIIEHMRHTGEWGEYFPARISPFAYNETRAPEYYPLTKEEIAKRGLFWREHTEMRSYKGPQTVVPDDITDVPNNIVGKILVCEVTGQPYRLIEQELKFYRENGIPIPRLCPDARHKERMSLRNPRKLWDRKCDKCSTPIKTTYAPDRPEKVYCEKCYLSEVY